MTAPDWEDRAAALHDALLGRARTNGQPVERAGRDGWEWVGSRETVLRDLWPDAVAGGRSHPYGGSLSRKLDGHVVKVGTRGGESVWWIAADRTEEPEPAFDPRECPTCERRFPSVQSRRGHQASHRTGPRRLWTDGDLIALALSLAAVLAAQKAPTDCPVHIDGRHRCLCRDTWATGRPAPAASVWPPLPILAAQSGPTNTSAPGGSA